MFMTIQDQSLKMMRICKEKETILVARDISYWHSEAFPTILINRKAVSTILKFEYIESVILQAIMESHLYQLFAVGF